MLKIKDSVDLKELSKKYGMIYCVNWTIPYEDNNYGWIMQVPDEAFKIWWRDDRGIKGEIRININHRTTDDAIDMLINMLYDLIKADLVVKVDD